MKRSTDRPAHAILPLAILEAMRKLDSPSDEEVAEYVDELLKKRLGLSSTVAAQIGRYSSLARRDGTVSLEELEQVLRLAGRRSDAALVFSESGRGAAKRALRRMPAMTRWLARHLPGPVGRAVGFRAARAAAAEVFDVSLSREMGTIVAWAPDSVAVRATPDGTACGFVGAGLAELMRQLVDFDGIVVHARCQARGDERCEWRPA